MMMPEKLTLQEVKKKAKVRNFRASDFLSDQEMNEIHKNNAKGLDKRRFDDVDAYIAEILARFGWETYRAWKAGDIAQEQMTKYIEAERSRTVREMLMVESVFVSAIAGANQPTKSGQMPKTLKNAIKELKNQQQYAKGDK